MVPVGMSRKTAKLLSNFLPGWQISTATAAIKVKE